jgi:glycosyltransferase involved in cell wall biosynthesis
MQVNRLLAQREIEGSLDCTLGNHVAFLGIYNAKDYINDIIKWTTTLDLAPNTRPQILIVDNASTDGSGSAIRKLARTLVDQDWKVALVTNPINLGGWGSINLNLDLISQFEWVTTFHQDDQYACNHLREHIRACAGVGSNVGMISSESASTDKAGNILGYPRGTWIQSTNPNPSKIFLNLVKNHFLPFSGASFRIKFLLDTRIPWTSTAFPDTELLLRGLPVWNYLHLDEPRVTYLENETSESHSLNLASRQRGSVSALLRVFSAESFLTLVCQMETDEFRVFCFELIKAIEVRLSERTLAKMVARFAIELSIERRIISGLDCDYSALSELYAGDGDLAAASLATRLQYFQNEQQIYNLEEVVSEAKLAPVNSSTKLLVLRILGRLPRHRLMRFWKFVLRFSLARKILRHWDLK